MKIFHQIWTVCVLLHLTVKAQSLLNTIECSDDEECRPINECKRESKLLEERKLSLLKFCGIWRTSTEHCCKIEASSKPPAEVLHVHTDALAANQEVNLTKADVSGIASHKNMKLINNARFCGKATVDRIAGGEIATVNQFPWITLLEYRSKDEDECESYRCGGSLISERYVLTAANCILQSNQEELFSVRLGEHTISTQQDCADVNDFDTCSEAEDIPIESFKVHEGYDPATKANDIALIRLTRPVAFSKELKHIKPVCLPVNEAQQIDNMDEEFHTLTIAGWGHSLNSDEPNSDVLVHAMVSYLPQDICEMEYAEKKEKNASSKINIQDTQMCAAGGGEVGACKSDIGSALIGVGELEDGKFRMIQQGIFSDGPECGSTQSTPGVYTRVSKYIKWILDNISA